MNNLLDDRIIIDNKKFTEQGIRALLKKLKYVTDKNGYNIRALTHEQRMAMKNGKKARFVGQKSDLHYTEWQVVDKNTREANVRRIVASRPWHVFDAMESFAEKFGLKIESFMDDISML